MNKLRLYQHIGKWGLLFLLFGLLVWKGLLPGFAKVRSDFPNYYISAKVILSGKNYHKLYDNTWINQQAKQEGIEAEVRFSPFPPITSLLMLPLAPFSPLTAKRIWTVFNLLLLVLCIRQVQRITNQDVIGGAILVLLSGMALINNFYLGQVYLLLALAILYAHRLFEREESSLSSFILSVCAWLKYVPAAFLFVYVVLGKRQVFLKASLFALGLLILQWLIFGSEMMMTFFSTVFLPHISGDVAEQSVHYLAFQSFDSLFSNIFIYDSQLNPQPWVDFPVGKIAAKLTLMASVLGSLIWFAFQSRSCEPSVRRDLLLIGLGLGTFVILPVNASYHFLILLLPMCLWVKHLWTASALPLKVLSVGGLLMIGFGSFEHIQAIVGREGFLLLACYPRLWGLVLVFVCFLILVQKLTKNAHA